MSKEYRVSRDDSAGCWGQWEVRDRADVFVSSHNSQHEAQAAARKKNEES